MNKRNLFPITSIAIIFATATVAETSYDDPAAIMAELSKLSEECAELESGAAQTEIFGIEIIRVGDTCAIVNGDEIDSRVRIFLEEENLPWAGLGIWVKVPNQHQAD